MPSLADELGAPVAERLRASVYARLRGLTPAAVSMAIQNGRIRRGADGLLSVAEADAYWQGSKRAAPRMPANSTVADSKSKKLAADARLAEVRAAEAEGELVSVAAIAAAWFACGRVLRERILAVPMQVSPLLAGQSDHEIRRILDAALREALSDLPMSPPS